MPVYGIIGIFRWFLAHNSVKYQNFSMRPSLFEKYCQITYSLQVIGKYLLKCGFYVQKTS